MGHPTGQTNYLSLALDDPIEAANRLPASLADMVAAFGARPAAVARELTKLFEEVRRGELGELARHYGEAGPPLGEVVVVIGPPGEAPPMGDEALDGFRVPKQAYERCPPPLVGLFC